MGQIDRSRRRRGCAGALRHKICTASLDNAPLIDGSLTLRPGDRPLIDREWPSDLVRASVSAEIEGLALNFINGRWTTLVVSGCGCTMRSGGQPMRTAPRSKESPTRRMRPAREVVSKHRRGIPDRVASVERNQVEYRKIRAVGSRNPLKVGWSIPFPSKLLDRQRAFSWRSLPPVSACSHSGRWHSGSAGSCSTVVVIVLYDQLGSPMETGLVTQRVTDLLNRLGLVTIVLGWLRTAVEWPWRDHGPTGGRGALLPLPSSRCVWGPWLSSTGRSTAGFSAGRWRGFPLSTGLTCLSAPFSGWPAWLCCRSGPVVGAAPGSNS